MHPSRHPTLVDSLPPAPDVSACRIKEKGEVELAFSEDDDVDLVGAATGAGPADRLELTIRGIDAVLQIHGDVHVAQRPQPIDGGAAEEIGEHDGARRLDGRSQPAKALGEKPREGPDVACPSLQTDFLIEIQRGVRRLPMHSKPPTNRASSIGT